MRLLHHSFTALSTIGLIGSLAWTAPAQSAVQEVNGVIVVEAEQPDNSLQNSDWRKKSPNSESTCRGSRNDYIRWESSNNAYGGPNDKWLQYNINVSNPGTYILRAWACQGTGGRGDEENDVWVSINNSEPKKYYSSTNGSWGFYFTEDHDEQKNDNATYQLNQGSNTLRIAGRSMNFALDAIALYQPGKENEAKSGSSTTGGSAAPQPVNTPAPAAPVATPQNYSANGFTGRIAYSADGNDNDPDDIGATPLGLAMIAKAGLQNRVVHFDYNSYIWSGRGDQYQKMSESTIGAAQRFGFDTSKFISAIDNPGQAQQSIANAINASSANNPLTLIVGGPMEVACQGIKRSQKDKRQYVTVISHSDWNNRTTENNGCIATNDGDRNAVPAGQINDNTRNIKETGVNFDRIPDQNRFINTRNWGEYDWLRDNSDANLRWVYDRMRIATGDYADPSDAGMVYYVLENDEDATPSKLQNFFAQNGAPVAPPVSQPAPQPQPQQPTPAPTPQQPQPQPAPSSGGLCTASDSDFNRALSKFEQQCGVNYDKSRGHDCDLVNGRWLCANSEIDDNTQQISSPPQPSTPSPAPQPQPQQPAPQPPQTDNSGGNTGGNGFCSVRDGDLNKARSKFEQQCGVRYDKSLGHDCDMENGGWVCANQDM